MSPRSFTKAVKAAVEATKPETVESFGPLLPGDEVYVTGPNGRTMLSGQSKAVWRFMHVCADGSVQCYGPVRSNHEKIRSFRPEAIQVPSTRTLNKQRQIRAQEGVAS